MPEIQNLVTSRNAALLASVTVAGVAVGYEIWRRSKLKVTGDFIHVGRIEKIVIFPIKSLPGIEVDSAHLTKLGLVYGPLLDRSFLLQKEESGMMMTLRQEPTLALLKMSLKNNCIVINAPGMTTLEIPVKTCVGVGDVVRTCRVYGQDINGIDCGAVVGQWFQKFLGKPGFRVLQYIPSFKPRRIINNFFNAFLPGQMTYHDDGTFNFLSEASIDELNSHLEEKVSHRNFRPNFLFSGCEAYTEDKLKAVKVGECTLLQTAPCYRCILTTVNPETGVKTEKEPLTTLRSYRLPTTEPGKSKYPNSPMFGVYMGIRKEGKVSVGDTIFGVFV